MPSSRLQSRRSCAQTAAAIQQGQPLPQPTSPPPTRLKAKESKEIWFGVTAVAASRAASHLAQADERAGIGRRAAPATLSSGLATASPKTQEVEHGSRGAKANGLAGRAESNSRPGIAEHFESGIPARALKIYILLIFAAVFRPTRSQHKNRSH